VYVFTEFYCLAEVQSSQALVPESATRYRMTSYNSQETEESRQYSYRSTDNDPCICQDFTHSIAVTDHADITEMFIDHLK